MEPVFIPGAPLRARGRGVVAHSAPRTRDAGRPLFHLVFYDVKTNAIGDHRNFFHGNGKFPASPHVTFVNE